MYMASLLDRSYFVSVMMDCIGSINLGVMYILDFKHIPSLFDMIGATEQDIHLFEGDAARLGNKEEDKNSEADVDASEKVERVAKRVGQ